MENTLLEWVVSAGYLEEFSFGPIQFSVEFMSTFSKSTMDLQYFTLTKEKLTTKNATPPMAFSSWMMHARMDSFTRGSK